MQLTGYPEVQLPAPETLRGSTRIEEMLDHGCAQAQDVACEHP
jgi:hypothetical protein